MSQTLVTESDDDDRLLAAYQPLFRQNARAIRDSWARCRSAGLGCCDRPRRRRVSAERLAGIYTATADVRALALAEMRLLHGHLGGRGFTLTLADPDSVILDCLPGTGMQAGDTAGLAPGHCWPESTHGTNAVGTAAAAGRVVVVAGEDHYLETYRGLICVAAPIFGADGELRAIIDATADQPIASHTLAYALGLMQMAGGHVQTELFRRRHGESYVVLLDNSETVASPAATALAFDADGRLQATTAGARTVFAHALMAPGTAFGELFVEPFAAVIDSLRHPAGFASLTGPQGRAFQATVYFPEPAPRQAGNTTACSAPKSSAASCGSSPYVADDAQVRIALDLAARAAGYGVPILVRGETGSGKEHVARHIHAESGRTGEFVAINCAGLPTELIEAELFGHVPGAFTGARAAGATGLVRRADGGTLFLDEIGDMPGPLQAHLLRLIDTWHVRPVGSDEEIAVDVQLVTATHRDLDAAVEAGAFRRDLLHRIGVCPVRLPPLRERSDVAAIAQTLLATIDDQRHFEADAIQALQAADWPGNIRELRNVIMRIVLQTRDVQIAAGAVKQVLDDVLAGPNPTVRQGARVSDAAVESAVVAENGNVAAAARRLGISRTTIYKHLASRR
ncbi:sigma 54-interacting transcriptional regulator [Salinisphaera sp. SPP-AMP-43]|uniref:sigma-54-dependent Fis family transcriptional regulator n=1 Tax=Salinisphaera sp. SPP-AMP-43 TaxID=3121288 RepID=UPI003C6E3A87